MRNICTTHVLDKVAESFVEDCYEVPVGFKHISAKMNETDAVIGGESSGGLTVRGHAGRLYGVTQGEGRRRTTSDLLPLCVSGQGGNRRIAYIGQNHAGGPQEHCFYAACLDLSGTDD